MFTSGSPDPAIWVTNNGNRDASREPGHSLTDDSDGQNVPANITNVLTVTNVSISDNGADYTCGQGFNAVSDIAYLTVFGELPMHLCMFVYYTYVHIWYHMHETPKSLVVLSIFKSNCIHIR